MVWGRRTLLLTILGLFAISLLSSSVSALTCPAHIGTVVNDVTFYKGPFETQREAEDNCNCGFDSPFIYDADNAGGCQVVAQDYYWSTVPPFANAPYQGACDHGGFAFEGSCYWVEPQAERWVDAASTCASKGGHLATIKSAEEDEFLEDYVATIEGSGFDAYVWIGLRLSNGAWRWIDDESIPNQIGWGNWMAGEPNGYGGNTVQLLKDWNTADPDDWSWNNHNGRNRALCEKPWDVTNITEVVLTRYFTESNCNICTTFVPEDEIPESVNPQECTFPHNACGGIGYDDQGNECTRHYGLADACLDYNNDIWSCIETNEPVTFEPPVCDGELRDGFCYNVFKSDEYWAFRQYSFERAQDVCETWGGQLASVHSQGENDFINGLIVDAECTDTIPFGNGQWRTEGAAWLGGVASAQRGFGIGGGNYGFIYGSEQWLDGTTWDYSNYNPGLRATGEDLAFSMFASDYYSFSAGEWVGVTTDNSNYAYKSCAVCKQIHTQEDYAFPGQYDLSCPAGYTKFQNSCYKYDGALVDWQVAEDACVADGAHLVSITSQDEQDFVMSIIDPAIGVWLGLNDLQQEGSMRWTNGDPLVYTNWQATQPSNSQNNEHCVHIRGGTGGLWNDKQCVQAGWRQPAICEIPLPQTDAWINAGQICQACDGEEVCDGVDNDCDGFVDNIAGTQDLLRDYDACTGPLDGVGACSAGYHQCVDGTWDGVCSGIVVPTAEICDGVDNDCDLSTDEFLYYASSTNFSAPRCSDESNKYPYLVVDSAPDTPEFVSCFADVRLPYTLADGNGTDYLYPDEVNGAPTEVPAPDNQRIVSYNPQTVQEGDACIIEGDFVCDPLTETWRGGEALTSLNGLPYAIARSNHTDISLSPDHTLENPSYSCCPENYCWNGNINQCVRTTDVPSSESLYLISGDAYYCADGDWQFIASKPSPLQDEIGYCFEETQCFYSWSGSPGGGEPCVNSSTQIGPYVCNSGTWVSTSQSLGGVLVQAYADLSVDLNVDTQSQQFGLYCGDVESTLNFVSTSTGSDGLSQLDKLRGLQGGALLCDLPQTRTVQESCAHRACTLHFDYVDPTGDDKGTHRALLGISLAQQNVSDIFSTEFSLFKEAVGITSCLSTPDDDGWIICDTDGLGQWRYNLHNGVALYLAEEYVSLLDVVLNILQGGIIEPIFNALALLFGDDNPTAIDPADYSFLSNGFVSDTFYYGKLNDGAFLASYDASAILVDDVAVDHSAVVLQYSADPTSSLTPEFICDRINQFNNARGDIFSCSVYDGTSAIAVGGQEAAPYWLDFTALLRPRVSDP